MCEVLLQFKSTPFVHEDGVRNHGRRRIVHVASPKEFVRHLQAELVLSIHIVESQHAIDLLLRLPRCSVVQHTQRVGDAQR